MPEVFGAMEVACSPPPDELGILLQGGISIASRPGLLLAILLLRKAGRFGVEHHRASSGQIRLGASSAELAYAIRAHSVEKTTVDLALVASESSTIAWRVRCVGAIRWRGTDPCFFGRSHPVLFFLDTGDPVNSLHRSRPSLPAVAAGVQGEIDFFGLIRAAPSPPRPRAPIRWGALFAHGCNYGISAGRLEMACALLGLCPLWRTPAVQAAIAGRADAPPYRIYFANIRPHGRPVTLPSLRTV